MAKFTARITKTGAIERAEAEPACLKDALLSLKLGEGQAGPMTGEISLTPPAGRKPLSFILPFEPRYSP